MENSKPDSKIGGAFRLDCPVPLTDPEKVLIGHGGGGRLTHQLIERLFLPVFGTASDRHDGAIFSLSGSKAAFTTDSYVVRPIFFPGGDIGSLAVNGTVNDLAMCGAEPLCLSAGFILEEGFPMESLQRVVRSMGEAAQAAGVQIVTGDTKVVDRGKGDGVYINTAGVGRVPPGVDIRPQQVAPGDAILLSGDIGRHGVAIMASREGLEFETEIQSDCMPLSGLVSKLLGQSLPVHCMRDLTRGGLAAALVEISEARGLQLEIDESRIAVSEPVRAACEILGLNPLHVANEGRMILFIPEARAGEALETLRAHPQGAGGAIIGRVGEAGPAAVHVRGALGVTRILDLPSGEQLPRIC